MDRVFLNPSGYYCVADTSNGRILDAPEVTARYIRGTLRGCVYVPIPSAMVSYYQGAGAAGDAWLEKSVHWILRVCSAQVADLMTAVDLGDRQTCMEASTALGQAIGMAWAQAYPQSGVTFGEAERAGASSRSLHYHGLVDSERIINAESTPHHNCRCVVIPVEADLPPVPDPLPLGEPLEVSPRAVARVRFELRRLGFLVDDESAGG